MFPALDTLFVLFIVKCLQCFDTVGWCQEEHPACKNPVIGVGVAICLERGADCLHIVQMMPLHPKTPSSLASFKSRLALPFWFRLNQVVLEKTPLNWCSSGSSLSCSYTDIFSLVTFLDVSFAVLFPLSSLTPP